LTEGEKQELQRVSRATSETRIRHQRAIALLAVAEGKSLSEAARLVGWKSHDPVTKVTRRFNSIGVCALSDLPRPGPHRTYGPAQQARILQEASRTPDRREDATATWSLSLLQRALRTAPDGLPKVSTFTILYTLHEAGYTWQKNRTWCHTGRTLKKGKDGTVYQSEDPYTQEKKTVIERAYVLAERLGLPLWCEDEAGPYQTIPHPGSSFQPEGVPATQDHQYIRGNTCKLLTLLRPATGKLRASPVDQSTNAILHPWLEGELTAILKECPPPPELVPEGRRWQDWDPFPAASQLDRMYPPLRMLLILDNLAGHYSRDWVSWCHEHGIGLLYTPCAGSWLNMAESVQRIILRRAMEGHHIYDVEILKDWLVDTIEGWNRHPTPFIWGGKRHTRRDRAYARRHRQGGSGATTQYVLPRRIRSVRYYRRVGNTIAKGK
jgi:transposase